MSTLGNKTFIAAYWQFLSVISQALLQLLVLGVLARLIAKSDFGLLAMVNIAIFFATIFTQGSLKPAIVQNQNLTQTHERVAFSLSLVVGGIFFIIFWVLAPLFANCIAHSEVSSLLRVVGVSFLINCLGVVSEALLEKQLRFKALFVVNFISYFFGYALIGIWSALSGYGAWALVYAMLAQSILRVVFLFLNQRHSFKFSMSRKELAELAFFSGGVSFVWFFNYIALQADNFIVARFLGAQALGSYNMAFTAMDMPRRYLGSVLEKVIFPAMSHVSSEKTRLQSVYLRSMVVLAIIMIPASILMVILAQDIVLIVLGEGWEDVVLPLRILLFQIPIRAFIRLTDYLATSLAANYQNAGRKGFYALLVVVCCFVGHNFGLVGVALGVSVSVLVNWIIVMFFASKLLQLKLIRLILSLKSGMYSGGIVLVVGVISFIFLDPFNFGPVVHFLLVASMTCFTFLAVVWFFPHLLGEAGKWLIIQTERYLPERLLVWQCYERFLARAGARR